MARLKVTIESTVLLMRYRPDTSGRRREGLTFEEAVAKARQTIAEFPEWHVIDYLTGRKESKGREVILAQSRTDAPGTMAAWYRAQQEAK